MKDSLKQLIESIVEMELLDEDAKNIKDLGGEGLALYKTGGGSFRDYYLYRPDRVEGMMKHFTKISAIEAMVGVINIVIDRECETWTVATVAAESGYGPIMYTIAMSDIAPEYLAADRGATSSEARELWAFMLDNRSKEFHMKDLVGRCTHYKATDEEDPALFKAFSIKRKVNFKSLESKHNETMAVISKKQPNVWSIKKLIMAGEFLFGDLYKG